MVREVEPDALQAHFTAAGDGVAYEELSSRLFDSLTQTFAVILLGYVAARCRLIADEKAVEQFVMRFLLPAIFFKGISELQWGTVSWELLLVTVAVRALCYPLSSAFTYVTTRRFDGGATVLCGLFFTLSNDMALGLPIFSALYHDSRPEFVTVIYLFAVVNALGFLPLTLLGLEMGMTKSAVTETGGSQPRALHLCRAAHFCRALRIIALKPEVLMSVLGLICNFAFARSPPEFVSGVFTFFAMAFPATALFLIGVSLHRLTEHGRSFTTREGVLVFLLVFTKQVVFPLLLRGGVSLLVPNDGPLSMYAYLYGSLPPAPTICIYALHYGIIPEVLVMAVTLSTLLCAPPLVISVKMMLIQHSGIFSGVVANFSILGAAGAIWCVLLLSRRSPLSRLTILLASCVATSALGAVAFTYASADWQRYGTFIFYYTAKNAALLLVGWIALAVLVLRLRLPTRLHALAAPLTLTVCVIPLLATGSVLVLGDDTFLNSTSTDPLQQCGHSQSVADAVVSGISLVMATTAAGLCLLYTACSPTDAQPLLEPQDQPLLGDTSTDSGDSDGAELAKAGSLPLTRHALLVACLSLNLLLSLALALCQLAHDAPSLDLLRFRLVVMTLTAGQGLYLALFFGFHAEEGSLCDLVLKRTAYYRSAPD